MARHELTISETYASPWGLSEAIREIIQNAQDSQVDGHPMSVEHKKDRLIVCNRGITLDHSVFLLGNTSKAFRRDQAGQFGEGLKLAMLVFARKGIPMVMRNGDEVWEPKIEASEKYNGQSILVVHTRKGGKDENRFQVEIGFPSETWEGEKWRYLSVSPRSRKEVINTTSGKVLMGEEDRGRVFVKGIYVCTVPGLEFGYDLYECPLDRDRHLVPGYELRERVKPMMSEAISQGSLRVEKLWDMMSRGAPEVNVGDFDLVDPKTAELIAGEFSRRFGDMAFPVLNMADATDLEHLGKTGIVLSKAIVNALRPAFGTIDDVRAKLKDSVKERVQWVDLTDAEKSNINQALLEINAVPDVAVKLSDVEVAIFLDGRLRGMYKAGKAILSRSVLADLPSTLGVLIHEVSHRKGVDGDKAHVAEIERVWRHVYENKIRKA